MAVVPRSAPSEVDGGLATHDYQIRLDKLRADAAECRLISDLAADPVKRDLFDRLAAHMTTLGDHVEQVMLDSQPVFGEGKDAGHPQKNGPSLGD